MYAHEFRDLESGFYASIMEFQICGLWRILGDLKWQKWPLTLQVLLPHQATPMSCKRPREEKDAVLPVLCPSCAEHFRAGDGASQPPRPVPHRLPCAHCICILCLDVLEMSEHLFCPVCARPALPHQADLALAAYAEEVFSGASAEPAALNMHPLMVAGRLSAMSSSSGTCLGKAECMSRDADILRAHEQQLEAQAAASAAEFACEIDTLHAALNACYKTRVKELDAVVAKRRKQLTACVEELEISASQLRTGAAMADWYTRCDGTVITGASTVSLAAYSSMENMCRPDLNGALVLLKCDLSPVQAAIGALGGLRDGATLASTLDVGNLEAVKAAMVIIQLFGHCETTMAANCAALVEAVTAATGRTDWYPDFNAFAPIVRALPGVIAAHPTSPRVVLAALTVLATISNNCGEAYRCMLDVGMLPTLCKVGSEHKACLPIALVVSRLLKALFLFTSTRHLRLQVSASLCVVVEMMQYIPETPGLLCACMEVFSAASQWGHAAPLCVDVGAVGVIVAAVTRHGEQSDVAVSARTALNCIGKGAAETMTPSLAQLVKNMTAWPGDATFLAESCNTLARTAAWSLPSLYAVCSVLENTTEHDVGDDAWADVWAAACRALNVAVISDEAGLQNIRSFRRIRSTLRKGLKYVRREEDARCAQELMRRVGTYIPISAL